ncbi:uncharacterized protein L199_007998 [Kwoniella botswanensis]|uniref:uncharacterized protein n=1 Tax=Kwoniella botswanensis TaxID=1268659 RepID=UPI00315CA4D9
MSTKLENSPIGDDEKHAVDHLEAGDPAVMNEAVNAEELEHSMGVLEAAKAYPMGCFWAFVICFCIIMESYDTFLIGNFVALPSFTQAYGIPVVENGVTTWVLATRWQTALQQAGQIGAFIGIFICGPLTDRVGYRYATLVGLVLMIATIFISFFAKSLPIFLVGQLLEGIPWGFFIANAPAYSSEVVPLPLRGIATAFVMMGWSLGNMFSNGIAYHFNTGTDEWSYRIPFAIQWVFPVPLLVLIFFAPESPWWLVRKGRHEEAVRSIKRLGSSRAAPAEDTLAMITRTIEIEEHETSNVSYAELFKGSDLRRTLIVCGVYAAQNWAGNLIANQATFFFQQAGLGSDFAFKLSFINAGLQVFGVAASWVLGAYIGRRKLYLAGTTLNALFALLLGVLATTSAHTQGGQYGQAVLGIFISFIMGLILGPVSYTIIAETSSIRLRALTTGLGRAAYYCAEIPTIFLSSWMLNPTGGNLAGKCGYVWFGTATVCLVVAYFQLPEMRHRSYRELDILFHRRTSARKFASTDVAMVSDE